MNDVNPQALKRSLSNTQCTVRYLVRLQSPQTHPVCITIGQTLAFV